MVPQDTNVADGMGKFGAERFALLAESVADRDASLEQVFGFDGLDRGQGGSAGDRVAAECRGVHAGLENRGDLRTGHHHAHRRSRRPCLGTGQDVGNRVCVLIGEPATGAAHSGLDLVQNQEHSALVAQLRSPAR